MVEEGGQRVEVVDVASPHGSCVCLGLQETKMVSSRRPVETQDHIFVMEADGGGRRPSSDGLMASCRAMFGVGPLGGSGDSTANDCTTYGA